MWQLINLHEGVAFLQKTLSHKVIKLGMYIYCSILSTATKQSHPVVALELKKLNEFIKIIVPSQ